MSYPLVGDLAAEGIAVRLTCGVLGHSAQAYYAWAAAPISQRDLEDAYLTNALIDAHGDDPEFGYRFLADEVASVGLAAGERRIWRLCSEQKLWSTTVRKGRRGAGKTPGPAVHDDHVQRNFTAQRPDQVWVTDITEHPTAEGKVYCAAVLDVFSRVVVGWSIADHMRSELVVDALEMARWRRRPGPGAVVHSDRGSQYTSWIFGHRLRAAGLLGSMGRVASSVDNGLMESFWSTLQRELLDRQTWATRAELGSAIFEWIEAFYNPRRRHSALGYLPPVQFEELHTATRTAA